MRARGAPWRTRLGGGPRKGAPRTPARARSARSCPRSELLLGDPCGAGFPPPLGPLGKESPGAGSLPSGVSPASRPSHQHPSPGPGSLRGLPGCCAPGWGRGRGWRSWCVGTVFSVSRQIGGRRRWEGTGDHQEGRLPPFFFEVPRSLGGVGGGRKGVCCPGLRSGRRGPWLWERLPLRLPLGVLSSCATPGAPGQVAREAGGGSRANRLLGADAAPPLLSTPAFLP